MKEFDVKTLLTEGQYKAMHRVIEAKGLTAAGYIRHLVIQDIVSSEDLVSRISALTEMTKTGQI